MAEDAAKQDALFVNIVLVFKSAAMQQMGKIMNPISGDIEKNLDQARFSIDTLEMLKAKTRGNLSDELNRLLDSTLMELRMNYVEEAEAEAKAETKAKAEGEAGTEGEAKTEAEAGRAGEAPGESKQDTGAGAAGQKPAKATRRSQRDGGDRVTAAGGTAGAKTRGGKRPGKGKAGKGKRSRPKRSKRT